MIRSRLLAATALTPIALLLASPAYAFDWSGFYGGMFVGAHQSESIVSDDAPDFEGPGPSLLMVLPPGANVVTVPYGGFNVGYNVQMGNFVLGIEGDLSASSASGSVSDFPTTTDYTLESLMSLRARAGFAVDKTLFFATAGLAAGSASISTTYTEIGKEGDQFTNTGKMGLAGWIFGGGIEHAVLANTTLKIEGFIYNLGTGTYQTSGLNGPQYTTTGQFGGTLVRAGINVHF